MPSDRETGEVFDLPKARAPSAAKQAIADARAPEPAKPEVYTVPASFAEAVRLMVNRPLLADKHRMFNLSQRALRDGAHPDILRFEEVFTRRMAKLGIPVFAHCVVRTPAEQLKLYRGGQSKDSPADGMWPHKGCAVDLVHATRAWNLSSKEWLVLGHVGKEAAKSAGIAIEWGGDWKFYDPAHWQLAGWKNLMEGYPWPK